MTGRKMLYHTAICVDDVARAASFYDAVLGALGWGRILDLSPGAVAYGQDHGEFWIQTPANQGSDGPSAGCHFAFAAKDRAAVQAFFNAALKAGGAVVAPPAAHPEYHPHYYGAVVTDLDGNKAEVLVYPRGEGT
jgi:catechol 2,3-dioxygenase-like lactoylglutathione lyase family enzyme